MSNVPTPAEVFAKEVDRLRYRVHVLEAYSSIQEQKRLSSFVATLEEGLYTRDSSGTPLLLRAIASNPALKKKLLKVLESDDFL